MKKPIAARHIVQGALIAALYVVLTLLSASLGLSGGSIQLRLSEALCVLPCFTPFAIGGLFVGCLIANVVTGAVIWDVICGSIATLLGALGTYLLRKHRFLSLVPPIAANTLIIPFVLRYAYGTPGTVLFFMLTVGIGELLSCGVLGMLLRRALGRHANDLFRP